MRLKEADIGCSNETTQSGAPMMNIGAPLYTDYEQKPL